MTLSEKLAELSQEQDTSGDNILAAELADCSEGARALEGRVESLKKGTHIHLQISQQWKEVAGAANARAEAADAKLARVRELICGPSDWLNAEDEARAFVLAQLTMSILDSTD